MTVSCNDQVSWKNWMENLSEFKISADAKFADIIVPTMDTIRCTFVLELLLCCQKTVGEYSHCLSTI